MLPAYQAAAAAGHRFDVSSPVLFEWLRGPRIDQELELQRQLHPSHQAVPFGSAEASVAARLYRHLAHARRREMDIAIAACAIEHGAALWTMNPDDFRDIPDLQLYVAP